VSRHARASVGDENTLAAHELPELVSLPHDPVLSRLGTHSFLSFPKGICLSSFEYFFMGSQQ
jgi:hypothetical protein